MDLSHLKDYVKAKAEEFPEYRYEFLDIYVAAKQEIDDGESEENEVELAINEIDEICADSGIDN